MAEVNVAENIINNETFKNNLVDLKFQNANKGELQIELRDFTKWKKLFKERLLNTVNFNELEMIVVSSHGTMGYNSATAMVTSYDDSSSEHFILPPTVKNLIRCLFYSFKTNTSVFRDPNNENYDYRCTQLKKNVFFINVSLTTEENDFKLAVCSISFINELLKKMNNKKIAVVDLRLLHHKHVSEIAGYFDEEESLLNQESMRQSSETFKIINPEINNVPCHNFYLLCNTKNTGTPCANFIKTLQQIDSDGYPIRKMYLKKREEW